MRDEISYNQHLDMFISSGEKQSLNPHRIEILIHTYFPSLIEKFNDVNKANRIRSSIVSEHKRSNKAQLKQIGYIEPLTKCHLIMEERYSDLKQSIIKELASTSNMGVPRPKMC